ncbi:MAG: hypothetical protein KIT59_10740 [Nitrosomonas sp.]|nr:hypothetical protein [Nitrosomonas sp.]
MVHCFKKGEEYTHGGLSLQECLTLQLTVTQGASAQSAVSVEFTDVVWKGLRCIVVVDGNFSGMSLDVRSQAGNSASSVVVGVKPLKDSGKASVVVEDDDMEGQEATVVLIDSNGLFVYFQNGINNASERGKLGGCRFALAPVSRRYSVLAHLLDSLAVNSKITRHFAFAFAFHHDRTSNLYIEFHCIHPHRLSLHAHHISLQALDWYTFILRFPKNLARLSGTFLHRYL